MKSQRAWGMKKNSPNEFIVLVSELEVSFPCRSDEYLYSAMRRAGLFEGGCRGGGCGICKVRLLDGEVLCDSMSREHITREEEAGGYILACRAKLRSAIVLTFSS